MILEQLYILFESVKNQMEEGRLPLVIGATIQQFLEL